MSARHGAAVFSLLTLVAAPARADLLWSADLESGDLSQLGSLAMEAPDRIQVVEAPDPVWTGQYALRFELRDGDIGHPNHGHKVSAIAGKPCGAVIGTDRFYAWHLYVPDDYPPVTSAQAIAYWRARGTSPHVDPIEIRIEDDTDLGLHVTGDEVEIWRGPYQRGAWNEIVVHGRFDVDAAKGSVELWVNGALVVPETATATMAPQDNGNPPGSEWQLGNFPLGTSAPTYVLHVDDVRCGDAFEDVASPLEGGGGGGGAPDPGVGGTGGRAEPPPDPDPGTGAGGAPAGAPASPADPPADESEGGCAVSPGSAAPSDLALFVAALLIAAAGRATRRAARASPRLQASENPSASWPIASSVPVVIRPTPSPGEPPIMPPWSPVRGERGGRSP